MRLKKWFMLFSLFILINISSCFLDTSPTESPLTIGDSPIPTDTPKASSVSMNLDEAIVFSSNRSGTSEYYLMNPDGSNVQPMNLGSFPGNALIDLPVWSREMNRFLLRVTIGSNSDIYIVGPKGDQVTNLTDTPDKVEADPVPSPDGEYIAFVGVASDLDVFIMRSDGRDRLNLTKHPAREVSPRWSPDSDEILFTSNREGTSNIFIVNRDGSGLKNLSEGSGQDVSFSWSPDGERILFQSDRDGDKDIYTMDAQGGDLLQLTNNTFQDVEPIWSPDGESIAFCSDREGGWDIYLMDKDGENVKRLTRSPEVEERAVSWAPSHTQLVYTAEVADQFEVFVFDLSKNSSLNLTNHTADDFAPIWIRF
jgi:TolB protein